MNRFAQHMVGGALFAASLLAVPCAALAKDEPDPVVVDAAFKPAEQAGKVFKTAYPDAFKGVTRVAVPLFSVEFVIADNVSAQTSGFGSAGRSNAAAYYKLKGLAEPDFQALAQTLYGEFLRDLKAAGIEVLAQDQVAASAVYRKLAASGVPSPIQSDAAIIVAPTGMAIYGANKTAGSGNKSMGGAFSAFGSAMSAVGAAGDTLELQKELNATILEVQLRVHFVQLTNNNKGFFGRMAGSASVSGNVFPNVTTATLNVQNGPQRGGLTLHNPLALDAAAFAEVREAPTTAADVAGGIAVALIRLASGSNDSSSSKEMEAITDPTKYATVVGPGLGTVREMFVHRLRGGQ